MATKYIPRIIRITKKQDDTLKALKKTENFQLSPWARQELDKYLFGDPDYIEAQIQSNETLIQELTQMNKKLKQEKLDVVQRNVERKERLKQTRPVIPKYGSMELRDKNKQKKIGGDHGSSA